MMLKLLFLRTLLDTKTRRCREGGTPLFLTLGSSKGRNSDYYSGSLPNPQKEWFIWLATLGKGSLLLSSFPSALFQIPQLIERVCSGSLSHPWDSWVCRGGERKERMGGGVGVGGCRRPRCQPLLAKSEWTKSIRKPIWASVFIYIYFINKLTPFYCLSKNKSFTEIWFIHWKIYLFKVNNSIVLSIFTGLGNDHNLILEHFHYPRRISL